MMKICSRPLLNMSPSAGARRQQQQARNAIRRDQEQLERQGRAGLPQRHEEAFAAADKIQEHQDTRELQRQRQVQEDHQQRLVNWRQEREERGNQLQPGELRQAIEQDRLRHPNDVDLNTRLQQSVRTIDLSLRPAKTSDAIDPKATEYYQFCDYAYANDPYKYTLSSEKMYSFFFARHSRIRET